MTVRLLRHRLVTLGKAFSRAMLFSALITGGMNTMAEEGVPLSAEDLIEALGLEGHVEGGFFRRTFEARDQPRVDAGRGERFAAP